MQKKKIKVLLVDNNMDYLREMSNYINLEKDMETVGIAQTGEHALEILHKKPVDLMLMDIIMPSLDGIGVLKAMQTMQFKIRPRVCIYSSVSHDRMTSQILALGAMFMIIKPTPSDIIIERLRMLAGVPVTPTVINFGLSDLLHNLEAYVTKLIRKIGIPSHLVGQKYLRTAILMSLDDSSLLESITKGLYPTVAKVYGITNPKVERDIRHSIDVAWANGGAKELNNFLGEPEAAEGPRPTNSEFIALIVDRLNFLIKEQKEAEEKIPAN